jgi:hypothetical protein
MYTNKMNRFEGYATPQVISGYAPNQKSNPYVQKRELTPFNLTENKINGKIIDLNSENSPKYEYFQGKSKPKTIYELYGDGLVSALKSELKREDISDKIGMAPGGLMSFIKKNLTAGPAKKDAQEQTVSIASPDYKMTPPVPASSVWEWPTVEEFNSKKNVSPTPYPMSIDSINSTPPNSPYPMSIDSRRSSSPGSPMEIEYANALQAQSNLNFIPHSNALVVKDKTFNKLMLASQQLERMVEKGKMPEFRGKGAIITELTPSPPFTQRQIKENVPFLSLPPSAVAGPSQITYSSRLALPAPPPKPPRTSRPKSAPALPAPPQKPPRARPVTPETRNATSSGDEKVIKKVVTSDVIFGTNKKGKISSKTLAPQNNIPVKLPVGGKRTEAGKKTIVRSASTLTNNDMNIYNEMVKKHLDEKKPR